MHVHRIRNQIPKFVSSVKDRAGQNVKLHVTRVVPFEVQGKPRVIHWVPKPVPVQVRLYTNVYFSTQIQRTLSKYLAIIIYLTSTFIL